MEIHFTHTFLITTISFHDSNTLNKCSPSSTWMPSATGAVVPAGFGPCGETGGDWVTFTGNVGAVGNCGPPTLYCGETTSG